MMFARIIVGYDGSFEAHAALRLALELAGEHDRVRVTAVAVAHLPRAAATVGEVRDEQQIQEARCRQQLAAAVAYARDCGHRIDTQTVVGRTAPALLRAAVEHRADLLVIGGARRRMGWIHLCVGSIPAVVRKAPCPVLIANR
jgi:nucleotide-binding universal stress UspA family protein